MFPLTQQVQKNCFSAHARAALRYTDENPPRPPDPAQAKREASTVPAPGCAASAWASAASPLAQLVKNLPASAGDTRDMGLIPGLGRSPGEGNGYHSNILAWKIPWTEEPGWATLHGVTKSWAWLSAHIHIHMSQELRELPGAGLGHLYPPCHLSQRGMQW